MKFVGVVTLIVIAAFGSLALPYDARNEGQHEGRSTRFPGSRMTRQGDVFMGWPFPVREWFVESAFAGYKVGYDKGCSDGKARPHKLDSDGVQPNGDACPNHHEFDNKAMLYANKMTEFYAKYPEDRDLPLAFLIQMLIDSKPKTIDEIHQWVGNANK